LNKKAVPPAVFVDHKLVTSATIDHFYPNDSLMQTAPATNNTGLLQGTV